MRSKRVLQKALDLEEFVPYFQPIFCLRTNVLSGYEVLARWRRGMSEVVLPADFLPEIEHWKLSSQLTEHMLRGAFANMRGLQEPHLSVNVTPSELRNRNLPRMIQQVAQQTSFSLMRLTVEITENALIDHLPEVCAVAEQLRELGISLSLDDFGTGYSSLTHLQALPLQELKVDQSFVRHMQDKRESRKIVAAVVGLGKSLGLTTVAEGVEEAEQAEMLQCLGCDLVQGWLYGKPQSPQEVLASAAPAVARSTSCLSQQLSLACLEAMPSAGYAQLRAIYDSAPVGLCFLDLQLRYVSLNQRLTEMSGRDIRDYVGRRLSEVEPQVYAQAETHFLKALQGEATDGVEIVRTALQQGAPDETHLVSFKPARDEADEIIGVLIAVVDISERKRYEEAVRESEARLQAVIDAVPVGIAIAEAPTGRVVSRNPAAQEILGQDPIGFQAVADYAKRVSYTHNGVRLQAEQFPMARALALGLKTELQPVRYDLGNSREKWLRISGAPIRNERREIVGAVAVIQEVQTPRAMSSEDWHDGTC